MAPQLAWIGLGNMGRGMTKNIVEKGNLDKPLILYNRTAARAEQHAAELGSSKVQISTSIPEVVSKADIIMYCLSNDEAVEAVVDEILKCDNLKGKLLVDHSTVHPDTTKEESSKVRATGAEFLACPVFGPPEAANAGQLIMCPAGPKASVERFLPYCKGVIGRAVIDFADVPSERALVMKLIGNAFIFNMITMLAEGHVVAEKTGLGTDKLDEFVKLCFGGPYSGYSDRMRSDSYYNLPEPLMAVDLARKDLRCFQDIAHRSGTTFKFAEVTDDYLVKLKEVKGEKGDAAGIYGVKRMEAGMKFENK